MPKSQLLLPCSVEHGSIEADEKVRCYATASPFRVQSNTAPLKRAAAG